MAVEADTGVGTSVSQAMAAAVAVAKRVATAGALVSQPLKRCALLILLKHGTLRIVAYAASAW